MMTTHVPANGADALARARAEIERIDQAIVDLIAQRVKAAELVAEAKRSAGLPVLDPAQEARVVRRVAQLARTAALSEEGIRDCFWRIITLTRRSQEGAA